MFDLLICPVLPLTFFHLHDFQELYVPFLSDELLYPFLSDSQEVIRPSCILISNHAVIAFDQFFCHVIQPHLYHDLNLWCLNVTLQVINWIEFSHALCVFL